MSTCNGLGMMGGSLTAGNLVGYVFVVPGLGTVAIAGLLDVPLGTMLIYGLLIGPATAVLTTVIFGWLLRLGFWNPDKDEAVSEALLAEEALAAERADGAGEGGSNPGAHHGAPPLFVALLPILVPLVLIATGAIAAAAGNESDALAPGPTRERLPRSRTNGWP